MHTPEEVRLIADHSDAPQRAMLLSYAALLEAMERRCGSDTPIQRDFVTALRNGAAEILKGQR